MKVMKACAEDLGLTSGAWGCLGSPRKQMGGCGLQGEGAALWPLLSFVP